MECGTEKQGEEKAAGHEENDGKNEERRTPGLVRDCVPDAMTMSSLRPAEHDVMTG
jgi:hypothetical protein